jgi:hypothetical protein
MLIANAHRPKPQRFDFKLSNLYITKEGLVEVFHNKLKAEIPQSVRLG